MEPSGGADHRRREREGLSLLRNGGPPVFSPHQTLADHHLIISDDVREAAAAAGPDLSNPDPLSFAFAAGSRPPAVTSPAPAGPKPKMMHSQQQQQQQQQQQAVIKYRECLRNHAASVGGSVFDGCGEFMPAGEEGTLEALKCAACDCHRNFHRKETGEGSSQYAGYMRRRTDLQLPAPPAPPVHHPRPYSSSLSIVPPMSVAYGGAAVTESSSEDLNLYGTPCSGGVGYLGSSNSSGKKRFRTKFTQEQRDKMMEFAEKIGWRIQRQSEEEVERFCAEAGVKRQVFKVWMHNNKSSSKHSSSPPKPSQPDDHQRLL